MSDGVRGSVTVADTFQITGRGTAYVVVAEFDPPLATGDLVILDGQTVEVTAV
jgi:hypothetical protein